MLHCIVKIKRVIAFNLLVIVILSSMGFYSTVHTSDEATIKDNSSPNSTQLVTNGQDPSHEFRESFKINHASQSKTVSYNFFCAVYESSFEIICYAQYDSYLQKQLFESPSSKLFLDFRSLII